MEIVRQQCRAARALLDWSQDDLAIHARIAKKTIASFELGDSLPRADTLNRLRSALEKGGVEFIDENGGGAGVRLAKPRRKR